MHVIVYNSHSMQSNTSSSNDKSSIDSRRSHNQNLKCDFKPMMFVK